MRPVVSMSSSVSIPRRSTEPRSYTVASHALVEARAATIDALRDPQPLPAAPVLPARFLRHCDEQTVVGMHAVLQAAAAHPPVGGFAGHGVVAASCQQGRITAARSLVRLRDEGPATVSTQIVPQASLHSIAGAVSVGLGMHGPHLGVSGGPDALPEGIVAAISLLEGCGDDLPGVWVIVSEWMDEPALAADGSLQGDPVCRALALSLTAADLDAALPLPTLSFRMPRRPQVAAFDGDQEPPRLEDFARALTLCAAGTAIVSWAFPSPWGGEVRVGVRPAAVRGLASGPGLREAA